MPSDVSFKDGFSKRPDADRRFRIKLAVIIGLLGPLTLAVVWWASVNPALTESLFSQGLFRFWEGIPSLSGLENFPLGEILVYAFVGLFLAWFLRGVVRLIFPSDKHPRWKFFSRFLSSLVITWCLVSLLVTLFFWGWGFNYHRLSWADNHGWKVTGGTLGDLSDLTTELASKATSLRKGLPQDPNGLSLAISEGSWAGESVRKRVAVDAYLHSSQSYPLLLGGTDPAKYFTWTDAPSYLGLAGVYFPWTGEALVNRGPNDWSLPFAQAHENAHKRGWAREDEANFVAFFVLARSGQGDLAYSAALTGLLYAGGALAAQGTEGLSLWQKLYNSLDEGVKRDLVANTAYWAHFQGPVQKVAETVNDVYLKTQGQTDGVKSYGRMVDLLLYCFRSKLI